jgi:DNA-binding NarL/FixJ family response regulator
MVVLVVEDEAIIAYCSAAMLEDAGHAVVGPAHTAREALKLASESRPDVALIDVDLEIPGAGIGLARHLRAHYDTAIVFITGRVDLAHAHCDMAAGVVSKPYDPAALPSIVASAGATRAFISSS